MGKVRVRSRRQGGEEREKRTTRKTTSPLRLMASKMAGAEVAGGGVPEGEEAGVEKRGE